LKGEHADYGGRLRLVTSALFELVVSALQAPVRMLGHTSFVIGTLTGLRLEWKSPPRDATAIGWGDALRRVGLLAVPAGLLALLALPSDALSAPHVAPLLAALLLAVPLAVLSSHPRVGAALRGARMLRVPEEHRPPLTLRRAIEQRGFTDLTPLPAAQPPRVFAPAYTLRSPRVQRFSLALGSAAVAMFVALTPRYAVTPELPISLERPETALSSILPQVDDLPSMMMASDSPRRPARMLRNQRPAQMIDEALRQRARDAVQRTLSSDDEVFDPA
jgi:membrane glycosyltransferase